MGSSSSRPSPNPRQIAVKEKPNGGKPTGPLRRAYPPLANWQTADLLDWVREPEVALRQLVALIEARQLNGSHLITLCSSEETIGRSLAIEEPHIRARLFLLISALKRPPAPPPNPPEVSQPQPIQLEKPAIAALNKENSAAPKAAVKDNTVYFNENGTGKLPRGVEAYQALHQKRHGIPVFFPYSAGDGQDWKLMHIYDTDGQGLPVRYEIKISAMLASGGGLPKYQQNAQQPQFRPQPQRSPVAGNQVAPASPQGPPPVPRRSFNQTGTGPLLTSPAPPAVPPRNSISKPSTGPSPPAGNFPGQAQRPSAGPAQLNSMISPAVPNRAINPSPVQGPVASPPGVASQPSQPSQAFVPPAMPAANASRAAFCNQCGAPNHSRGNFCSSCGAVLASTIQPQPAASFVQSPGAVNGPSTKLAPLRPVGAVIAQGQPGPQQQKPSNVILVKKR